MVALYTTIVYQPLFNALVFLYQTIAFRDLGIAIVLLTLLIRLVLYPVFQKSTHHQMVAQKIQPELERINKTHRNDKEKLLKETMAVWREHGTHPFAGIMLMVVQLPILIALYHLFMTDLTPESFADLYAFVAAPAEIGKTLLGLIPLYDQSMLMVGITALAQYFQGKTALPPASKAAGGRGRKSNVPESAQTTLARRMVFVGPGMIVAFFIFLKLPNAIALYLIVNSLASIAQQKIINRELHRDHGELADVRKTTD